MVRLSVLDHSPVGSGTCRSDAIRDSVGLARMSEAWGYHRYWLTEHHRDDALAGCSPEVLIAAIGAGTSRIRLGSGGVLLSHYRALKVAEVFQTLESLYPGRIDLGIGRAPGGDPSTVAALAPANPIDFATSLVELIAELQASGCGGSEPSAASVSPPVWLLGSTLRSARCAADLGLPYCYAHFINPAEAAAALSIYRANFNGACRPGPGPQAMCAVLGLCASTRAEAVHHSASTWLWGYRAARGLGGAIPSPSHVFADADLAAAYREAATSDPRLFIDDAAHLADRLLEFGAMVQADELMITTVVADRQIRTRSLELLATALSLSAP